jgi:hypothetical protein
MKKTTKKLTAIMAAMLTVATVGATAAMPVFAETNPDTAASGDTPGLITGSAILPVEKTVRTKNNGITPETTFNFTIEADTDIKAEGETGIVEGAENTTVYQGITTGIKVDGTETTTMSIAFGDGQGETTTADGNTDEISETKNFDLSGVTFPNEGIYRYIVKEVTPTSDASVNTTDHTLTDGKLGYVTYDTTTYTVDVYVEKDNNGNNTVQYIKSVHTMSDNSTDKAPIEFENTVASANLNIVKKLAGNNYNAADTFKFYVTINEQAGLKNGTVLNAKITRAGETSSTEDTTITVGTETEITLGKDDSLEVYGVFVDTTYSVSEIPGTYTGTYKLDKAGTTSTGSAGAVDETSKKSAILTNETVVSGTNELVVTNKKNSTVDSGIVMTITPIAIAGGLAAAGAILVVTKRKLKK